MKHQKIFGAADHILPKQELERNKKLGQLYQADAVVEDDNIFLEITQMIPRR